MLCFGGCLGLSHLKFPNILRYSKAVRSYNVSRECFDNVAHGFSSEKDSPGAKSP